MAMLFVELGQDMRIVVATSKRAVNAGVREAYELGYLRKSVVDSNSFHFFNP